MRWAVVVDRGATLHLDAVQNVVHFLRSWGVSVLIPEVVEGLSPLHDAEVCEKGIGTCRVAVNPSWGARTRRNWGGWRFV